MSKTSDKHERSHKGVRRHEGFFGCPSIQAGPNEPLATLAAGGIFSPQTHSQSTRIPPPSKNGYRFFNRKSTGNSWVPCPWLHASWQYDQNPWGCPANFALPIGPSNDCKGPKKQKRDRIVVPTSPNLLSFKATNTQLEMALDQASSMCVRLSHDTHEQYSKGSFLLPRSLLATW